MIYLVLQDGAVAHAMYSGRSANGRARELYRACNDLDPEEDLAREQLDEHGLVSLAAPEEGGVGMAVEAHEIEDVEEELGASDDDEDDSSSSSDDEDEDGDLFSSDDDGDGENPQALFEDLVDSDDSDPQEDSDVEVLDGNPSSPGPSGAGGAEEEDEDEDEEGGEGAGHQLDDSDSDDEEAEGEPGWEATVGPDAKRPKTDDAE